MIKTVFYALLTTVIIYALVWYLKPDDKLSRLPASNTVGYDLSQLDNQEYVETVQEILVNTAKLRRMDADAMQLSFANFTSPKMQISVCQTYPWLEIVFAADGMAVNGNLPTLKVTTTCDSKGEKIQTEDIDLKSDLVEKENLDGYWLSDWYVKSIKLLSEDTFIEVTDKNFRQTHGDVLRL